MSTNPYNTDPIDSDYLPPWDVAYAAAKVKPEENKRHDCAKDNEIEKIKRQLAQLIDRVDALKKA